MALNSTEKTLKTPLLVRNSRVMVSVILSRPPQITRDSTSFEKAYFDYKEKLERGASTTFPTEFYFKKGSIAERRWKEEEAERIKAMPDTSRSLSDALVSAQQTLAKDETMSGTISKVNTLPRDTEADKVDDKKSLDRALQRTLYLVVRTGETPAWVFPEGQVDTTEYLHEAAERQLKESCGEDMDIWLVGRQPIGFRKQAATQGLAESGSKTFFMKARMFAGQVNPNITVSEFAWLTKEELSKHLSSDYYKAIKDCLTDI
ncbi:39S mitochondrial ribosomal protein L46-domain-containing protein [Spinellus fusiger]|nr:39S mitochondrial ribosomal protein L46-domain-containing protein [Spinellus fusiger]